MAKRVFVTGLGTISGLGHETDSLWDGVCAGRSGIGHIEEFDASGFETAIGAEVRDFKIRKVVPKSYRKATKVMARDIELAVAAADGAVRDAGLVTPGVDAEAERTYSGPRSGCHIGAGLIAADVDELTMALAEATDEAGRFDIHQWGRDGMNNLTPLWLLKYLPNMLACHVTIIHDAQGPSNTITCGEASSGLSIGESLRVIQRGDADLCFCGGAESKMNPMAFYRQQLMGRLANDGDGEPTSSARPFDRSAAGTVLGEAGGIVTLEEGEALQQRGGTAYAELVGFGASHTVYPEGKGLEPHPEGKGIAGAIRNALREARIGPEQIDVIVPLGSSIGAFDQSEAAAIRAVFGDRAADVPVWSATPFVGNCGAGAGGIATAVAARMLRDQRIPARINCDEPLEGLDAGTSEARDAELSHALVFSPALGGQNAALVLKRAG